MALCFGTNVVCCFFSSVLMPDVNYIAGVGLPASLFLQMADERSRSVKTKEASGKKGFLNRLAFWRSKSSKDDSQLASAPKPSARRARRFGTIATSRPSRSSELDADTITPSDEVSVVNLEAKISKLQMKEEISTSSILGQNSPSVASLFIPPLMFFRASEKNEAPLAPLTPSLHGFLQLHCPAD